MTKAQTPFLLVNPKSYLYGEKSLELAKAADKVCLLYTSAVLFAVAFFIKANKVKKAGHNKAA